MEFPVVVIEPKGGFFAFCPSLPGCHSYGATQEEALANIREAIVLWLKGAKEDGLKKAPKATRALVTVNMAQRVVHEPVLCGDPPAKVNIRVKPMTRKPLPSGEFDRSYIPLLAAERRARRISIEQWCFTHDVFVGAGLRKQEQREIPYMEVLHAMFGKAAQGNEWRLMLCWEAKFDDEAKQELASWLADAATRPRFDELTRFADCAKQVADFKETGPASRAKLNALLFVLAFESKHGRRPTQRATRDHLIATGIQKAEDRGNEARDVFNGPILGDLPKARPGRPKKN